MTEFYHGNNGRGPSVARIIAIANGVVVFEYARSETARRWTRRSLPVWFWNSTRCGWQFKKAK